MNRLYAYMDRMRPVVEKTLAGLIPRAEVEPVTLHEAMRYSVLGGGKRFRPLLCLMSAEACGGEAEAALPAACALEMIHGYSLVHDDLPAMDNDAMRRGKLTCHKAFGEAMAILAGDALLTLAFDVLARRYPPEAAAPLCAVLARAAGNRGMVAGQVMDLESEGEALDAARIEAIDRCKTGALITAACRMGGIVAGADEEVLKALDRYGREVGLAFQIADDLLDVEGEAASVGKATAKDAAMGKLTYPAALGAEAARELARDKVGEAKAAIKGFDKEALLLRLLADYVLDRER